MADVSYNSWIELYQEFKKRRLGWRPSPDKNEGTRCGMYSRRLHIYPSKGISV
jgi:hypothetical protein